MVNVQIADITRTVERNCQVVPCSIVVRLIAGHLELAVAIVQFIVLHADIEVILPLWLILSKTIRQKRAIRAARAEPEHQCVVLRVSADESTVVEHHPFLSVKFHACQQAHSRWQNRE